MTWEIDLVLWLQSFSWLVLPMAVVTALGSPATYLALIAAYSWWGDRPFALRLSGLLVVAAFTNDIAKLLFHAPRPYWVSADVMPYELQNSFGLPSGHAELAVALLGLVALRYRRPALTAALALLAALIGISRMVLGVHFPIDVLGGWLLGFAVLALFLVAWPPAARAAGRSTPRGRIAAAFVLSLAAVAASALVARALRAWAPDPAWTGLTTGLAPVSIEFTLIAAGFGLGAVLGHELDRGCRAFRSRSAGAAGTLLGLVVLVTLWFGPSLLLPPSGVVSDLGIYLRSAAIGVWIMAVAPAVFCRLGLYGGASPEQS